MEMNEQTTGRLYDAWSRIYDRTFSRLLRRNQMAAVEQLRLRPGDRVLDIGVGTGLMLACYPPDITVVGIDLSQGMLCQALAKCRDLGVHGRHLVRADAMRPPFPDASFDHLMISHTISVVSDPARLLRQAVNLVRPGGRIVLLNHFRSEQPLIAWLEKRFNPLAVKLGWRSDLGLEDLLHGAAVRLEYGFKIRVFDLWRIVVLSADPAPPAPARDPMPLAALQRPALALGPGR